MRDAKAIAGEAASKFLARTAVTSILVRGWAGSSINQLHGSQLATQRQRHTTCHADAKDQPNQTQHRRGMCRPGPQSGREDEIRRNEQLSATDGASIVRPARGPTSAATTSEIEASELPEPAPIRHAPSRCRRKPIRSLHGSSQSCTSYVLETGTFSRTSFRV